MFKKILIAGFLIFMTGAAACSIVKSDFEKEDLTEFLSSYMDDFIQGNMESFEEKNVPMTMKTKAIIADRPMIGIVSIDDAWSSTVRYEIDESSIRMYKDKATADIKVSYVDPSGITADNTDDIKDAILNCDKRETSILKLEVEYDEKFDEFLVSNPKDVLHFIVDITEKTDERLNESNEWLEAF